MPALNHDRAVAQPRERRGLLEGAAVGLDGRRRHRDDRLHRSRPPQQALGEAAGRRDDPTRGFARADTTSTSSALLSRQRSAERRLRGTGALAPGSPQAAAFEVRDHAAVVPVSGGDHIAVGPFGDLLAQRVSLDLIENALEIREVPLELDVVLAGAQDAVVVALDQDLAGLRRAGFEVPRRECLEVQLAVTAGEAGGLDLVVGGIGVCLSGRPGCAR